MRSRKIAVPPGLVVTGRGIGWQNNRGTVSTAPGMGKAPKRRFSPGQFIWVEKQLWEIVYAYRLASDPSEWIYCLEERKELKSIQDGDVVGQAAAMLGAGSQTPRVFNDPFRSSGDANTFFHDIPVNGDRKHFTNKSLLQKKAEVKSSGEVI